MKDEALGARLQARRVGAARAVQLPRPRPGPGRRAAQPAPPRDARCRGSGRPRGARGLTPGFEPKRGASPGGLRSTRIDLDDVRRLRRTCLRPHEPGRGSAPRDPRSDPGSTSRRAPCARHVATSATVAPRRERHRLGVRVAAVPQPHPDEAGQLPWPRPGTRRATRRRESTRRPTGRSTAARRRVDRARSRISPRASSRRANAGFSMPAIATSSRDHRELVRFGVCPRAIDDRAGIRATPSLARVRHRDRRTAGDQPRDLRRAGTRTPSIRRAIRYGAQGRERVVTRPDLDVGECLEERRLAHVRRPDQRDLARRPRGARSIVSRCTALERDARLLDLAEEPLAQIASYGRLR